MNAFSHNLSLFGCGYFCVHLKLSVYFKLPCVFCGHSDTFCVYICSFLCLCGHFVSTFGHVMSIPGCQVSLLGHVQPSSYVMYRQEILRQLLVSNFSLGKKVCAKYKLEIG